MPVQSPPVMTQQNETQHVGPENSRPSDPGPAPAGRAKILIGAALLVLITAGVVTFLNRKSESDALAKETEAVSIPTVAVVQPQAEPANDELVLPGNLQAFEESPIFARTNGYLLRWYKDIGSKIRKGELLAAIDTPEIDQELSQARASREQVRSALGLAKISADRWANLRKTDSVSEQEADQQASGYQQAQANLAAADANVRRLEQLESFKNVYAPFSGVLTRRNVDPGVLINSGAGLTGKELFDIARVDPIRVYVSVPQAYAPNMKAGMKATLQLYAYRTRAFTAHVTSIQPAADPTTQRYTIVLELENAPDNLMAGMTGEMNIITGTHENVLLVPARALLVDQALIVKHGTVRSRTVQVGYRTLDFAEAMSGLSLGDHVVVSDQDRLHSGEPVRQRMIDLPRGTQQP